MTNIQAAMGITQLDKIDKLWLLRKRYTKIIKGFSKLSCRNTKS